MLRYLPLCLLLAACGDDAPAPVVVTDTDVAVVEAAPDTLAADGMDETAVADAPAEAPAATPAPAPEPTPAAASIPAALASLPGETLYYKDGQEETITFQTGASPTSGQFIYTPNPVIDPINGTWSIKGNTLTFMGTTYTFDAADGAGTYQFQGPQGEMVLTIAAG